MTRRGRCHCGHLLHFQHGPHGFKVRCPQCGAVVRLGPKEAHPGAPSPLSPKLPVHDGATPLPFVHPELFPALSSLPEPLPLETNAEPTPLVFVEMAPLIPAPNATKFWTRWLLLLTLVAGLAALAVAALIGWFVWMATRTS